VIPDAIKEQIATLTDLKNQVGSGSALGFKLKEQIDALASGTDLFSNIPIVDERTKLRESGFFDTSGIGGGSSFDAGSFRMRENAGMSVTINVAGSVTSENDLAETIRSKILYDQQSGKPISFAGGL